MLSEALALLAFGLIQRWGELVPRAAAVVPAALGAAALTAIWTVGVPVAALTGAMFDAEMTTGTATTVQLVAYAPMALWGPLLGTLTAQHWKRRSPQLRSAGLRTSGVDQ
ncbi:hypothetical protein HPO96_01620 [Kribbella sandramycini]|uniref:Uncharacterized protein n=1 Tax=Kribbella sandramycini TaxID=60450 RepID=A0A7Y4KUT6_9ACTN|nr:hypothetical protein [Kribbella sandramycini]MBB6568476.1 hypothetical protein [Kribbella sandramycini]NOL38934.1 hypothetical protein [Kribbella sandramycini]